jgi:hypothetical protein
MPPSTRRDSGTVEEYESMRSWAARCKGTGTIEGIGPGEQGREWAMGHGIGFRRTFLGVTCLVTAWWSQSHASLRFPDLLSLPLASTGTITSKGLIEYSSSHVFKQPPVHLNRKVQFFLLFCACQLSQRTQTIFSFLLSSALFLCSPDEDPRRSEPPRHCAYSQIIPTLIISPLVRIISVR